MADVTAKRLEELELYRGPFELGQQFYFAGKGLGLTALGMNVIVMPPAWAHYPDHDHADTAEEEIYITLEGSGVLYAEGEQFPMDRGVLVRVGAATKRRIVPGPQGMTLIAISQLPDPKG